MHNLPLDMIWDHYWVFNGLLDVIWDLYLVFNNLLLDVGAREFSSLFLLKGSLTHLKESLTHSRGRRTMPVGN